MTRDDDAGLCASCGSCRIVRTDRSVFYLCQRALSDPRFRKYPPLPVRACRGYEPQVAPASAKDTA